MKKIFLTVMLAAFAASAWAEDTPKKPSFAGFVSNGFWDNWEVSAGVGGGVAFSNSGNLGSWGDRFGFEGNVSLTKWLHPVVGVRGQLQGGWFNNVDADLGKLKWPYLFVHADVMVNASNWIGGYREDRAWYAVPFAGFGYLAADFTDKSQQNNLTGTDQEFAFTAGLLNKFRVSPSVDINLELKGLMAKSEICPASVNGAYMFGFTATAGVTYRFNQRNWQRGVPGYTAEDIRAFQDAVAAGNAALEASKAENARLNEELTAAQAAAKEAEAAAAEAEAKAAANARAQALNTSVPTSIILYDYSMSKLTAKDKTRLELTADLIKNGPKDRVYTIQGHADQQTGTPAGNKRVAENRAKNVYNFLIKCGVNPKQLTYEGLGNEPDVYKNVQNANRSVIIK